PNIFLNTLKNPPFLSLSFLLEADVSEPRTLAEAWRFGSVGCWEGWVDRGLVSAGGGAVSGVEAELPSEAGTTGPDAFTTVLPPALSSSVKAALFGLGNAPFSFWFRELEFAFFFSPARFAFAWALSAAAPDSDGSETAARSPELADSDPAACLAAG